jgi:hypothetical protein
MSAAEPFLTQYVCLIRDTDLSPHAWVPIKTDDVLNKENLDGGLEWNPACSFGALLFHRTLERHDE